MSHQRYRRPALARSQETSSLRRTGTGIGGRAGTGELRVAGQLPSAHGRCTSARVVRHGSMTASPRRMLNSASRSATTSSSDGLHWCGSQARAVRAPLRRPARRAGWRPCPASAVPCGASARAVPLGRAAAHRRPDLDAGRALAVLGVGDGVGRSQSNSAPQLGTTKIHARIGQRGDEHKLAHDRSVPPKTCWFTTSTRVERGVCSAATVQPVR